MDTLESGTRNIRETHCLRSFSLVLLSVPNIFKLSTYSSIFITVLHSKRPASCNTDESGRICLNMPDKYKPGNLYLRQKHQENHTPGDSLFDRSEQLYVRCVKQEVSRLGSRSTSNEGGRSSEQSQHGHSTDTPVPFFFFSLYIVTFGNDPRKPRRPGGSTNL